MRKGPWCRIREDIERTMVGVDDTVVPLIRDCATGRAPWPLTLAGGVGTGKTCAALALCDYVRGRVRYITAAALGDRLADVKCGRVVEWMLERAMEVQWTTEDMWTDWGNQELCVIDDVGQRQKVSDTAYEAMKQALDGREGLPLIVTTNLTLDELGDPRVGGYDERIASRLAAGTVVTMAGDDRRLK